MRILKNNQQLQPIYTTINVCPNDIFNSFIENVVNSIKRKVDWFNDL